MLQMTKDMLITWNGRYGERAKLQHAYIAIAVLGIVVAGLVSLVDDAAGKLLVNVSLLSLGVLIANAVVWALLYSLVITRVEDVGEVATPRKTKSPSK